MYVLYLYFIDIFTKKYWLRVSIFLLIHNFVNVTMLLFIFMIHSKITIYTKNTHTIYFKNRVVKRLIMCKNYYLFKTILLIQYACIISTVNFIVSSLFKITVWNAIHSLRFCNGITTIDNVFHRLPTVMWSSLRRTVVYALPDCCL